MRHFRIERDADGLPARMVLTDGTYPPIIPLEPKTDAGLPRCLHVERRVQCAEVGVYPDRRGGTWCGRHRRR